MGVLYDYDEDVVLIRQAENPGDPTKITVNCPDKTGLGCDLCRIILQFGLSISREGQFLSFGLFSFTFFRVLMQEKRRDKNIMGRFLFF